MSDVFNPRGLNQKVTHWTAVPDGFGGFTFGTPVALLGRWEDKTVLFLTAKGDTEASRALVYLNADVDEGDYIFLGTSVVADPSTLAEARRIRQFNKTPDLRGKLFERKAFL